METDHRFTVPADVELVRGPGSEEPALSPDEEELPGIADRPERPSSPDQDEEEEGKPDGPEPDDDPATAGRG
ncbi:hypothetical protein [Paraconexibacter algicola]|uniref:Uncharacterized protein n=1 Tax=Paraconexibacter algicola TaxID=2133960 RepID=A0A2T4UL92_9ACTN|nr:hypothetical protein [Paraconexibacter algicola]PTL60012.1 hypothetical protein C7Y72_10310 [Paraconexibacter algicola]